MPATWTDPRPSRERLLRRFASRGKRAPAASPAPSPGVHHRYNLRSERACFCIRWVKGSSSVTPSGSYNPFVIREEPLTPVDSAWIIEIVNRLRAILDELELHAVAEPHN